MLGKVLDPAVMRLWAQVLEKYSPEQLTHGFNRTEREVSAWPAVAQLVGIIERDEFDAALALVLKGIKRHGYDWQDREAWAEGDKWDYHSDEAKKLGDRIKIVGKVHPAEPAPAIPARMVKTLELFGRGGDFREGLKRIWRDDPFFWTGETERETGQHGRQVGQIERDLWACWLRSA
jgi:hypothetical protein